MHGLTDSQKYLITVLIKIIVRLNKVAGGEEKAGNMLRNLAEQAICSLYARCGKTQKLARDTVNLVIDKADFKEGGHNDARLN